MAEVDSLTIKITSSATAASNAIDKLIKKLQALQAATNGAGLKVIVADMVNVESKTKSATNALSGFLSKFMAITAITKLLKSAISESMNYTETFNYFNVAMKNYTAQAEEYAQKVNSVMGINVEQWENAQATFMSLGSSFGIAGDKAELMSTQLTQLTYDLSSLKNVDPSIALQKLRSAMAGEIEPMRAWGVDISKAAMKLAAMELGITKTYNAMTQAEKAQLRYYIIMKQTTDAQGDMARTLTSPANQLRLLKQALVECSRALGNIFIPLLQRILPVAVAVVRALTGILEAIARLFGFKYPEVQWYGDYTDGVSGLGDEMDKTGRKAKKLKQQLAGFDEINNLTTNKGGGGGVGAGGGSWADFELPTYDFLGEAEAKINKLTGAIEDCLIPLGLFFLAWAAGIVVIQGATAPIGLIVAGIALIGAGLIALYNKSEGFRAFVQSAWEVIKGIIIALQSLFNTFGSFVIAGLMALWDGLKSLVSWIAQTAWGAIKTVWEAIKGLIVAGIEIFNTLKEFVIGVISVIWEGIKSAVMWLINLLTNTKNNALGLWDGIKAIWQKAPEWFANLWNTVKNKVAEKWTVIKQGAANAWSGIKATFAKVPEWFKSKFADAWQKVKNVFSTGGKIFDGIKEGIVNAFKTVVNAIITGINKIIATPFNKIKDILKTIRNIEILGIKPFGFINVSWSVPQIPKLATGGIITSPQLVMAGENGAEAIVPLENNTEWINKVAAQINSTGNNDDVVKAIELLIDVVSNKELIVDGKSLARGISKEINRQTRIMGEGLVY